MKDMIHDINNDMMTMTMTSPSSPPLLLLHPTGNPLLVSLWNYHLSMMKLIFISTSNNNNNNEIVTIGTSSNACLSLRQIVPMYQCWLDNNHNNHHLHNKDDDMIPHNDNNDIEFCKSILLSTSSSLYDQLVMIQYLLFILRYHHHCTNSTTTTTAKMLPSSSDSFDDILSFLLLSHNNDTNNITTIINHDNDNSSSCWDLLSYIVLPIMLLNVHHRNINNMEDEKKQQQDTTTIMNHPELIDAIFDATFQYHTTKDSITQSSSSSEYYFTMFQQCLHTCLYPEQKQKQQQQQQQQPHRAAADHNKDNNNHDDDDNINDDANYRKTHYNLDDWNISCQILYRIYQFIVSTTFLLSTSTTSHDQYYHAIMECIQTKIRIGIQLAFRKSNHCNDNDTNTNENKYNTNQLLRSILKPMIDFLIPCIIDTSVSLSIQQQHPKPIKQYVRNLYDNVWKTIIDTYDDPNQQPNQQQLNHPSSNTLLVSTTILCSILPSLLTIEQQHLQQIMTKDESTTTILQHRPLWDMVYMCLRQGIIGENDNNMKSKHDTSWMNHNNNNSNGTIENKIDHTSSSKTSSSDNNATCQLCRRRGIYLLHVLIQSSLLSSSDQDAQQQQQHLGTIKLQLQLWNQYVSCYETLEMESEQHLIDQVWATVTKLFHEYNDNIDCHQDDQQDVNSLSSIPNITWKWLSLLLAKSLTAVDAPVLRKFTLFRLLQGRAGIYYDINDDDDNNNNNNSDHDTNDHKQSNDVSTVPNENNHHQNSKKDLKKNQQRKQQKKEISPVTTIIRGAPISIIPPEFFVNIIITSFDSLVSSVGWNMHIFSNDMKNVPQPQQPGSGGGNSNNKKKVLLSIDLGILFSNFCQAYLLSMKNDIDKIRLFFHYLWNHRIVCQLHRKTIVHIFQAITNAIQTYKILIPVTDHMLETITVSYQSLFSLGSLVHKYKTIMLRTLATMLEYSSMSLSSSPSPSPSTQQKTVQYSPMSVLQILALYPLPNRNNTISNIEQQSNEIATSTNQKIKEDDDSWIDQETYWVSLRHWLLNVVCTPNMNHTKQSYMSMLGAAVATSYVDGILISSTPLSSLSDHDRVRIKSDDTSSWDPKKGPSNLERSISGAIGLLCALPCVVPTVSTTTMGNNTSKIVQNNNNLSSSTTTPNTSTAVAASEMLWPAIYKGLRYVNSTSINNNASNYNPNNTSVRTDLTKADIITRALLLLEVGCRLRIISGLGNGDLIISSKTGEMMPPPPHIEGIISNAIHFILQHIELFMYDGAGTEDVVGGGSRSNDARQLSTTFTKLVSQLQVLAESYPSSPTICNAIDTMLKENMTRFYSCLDDNERNSIHDDRDMNNNVVQHLCLVYATLSCGGRIETSQMLPSCRIILKLQFDNKSKGGGSDGGNSDNQQASRSIFQYAKWGALSCILPQILNAGSDSTSTSNEVQTFLVELLDVASVSVEATPSEALVPLFNCVISASSECFLRKDDTNTTTTSQLIFLEKVIHSMFRLLEDCRDSNDTMYVIDEICSLLFHPKMLLEEYHRIQQHGDNKKCPTPIRTAFRRFIEMAGTQKSYITRIVLSRICAGWIGECNDSESCSNTIGLTAIPYRTDIMNLLLHKEDLVDESSTNQTVYDCTTKNNHIVVPSNTNETSVTRGFLLVFLSKLPQVGDKLEVDVLNELLNPLIFDIMKKIQATGAAIMYGTPEYCVKMRGWQALCILSRFVTPSIAEEICKKIFYALEKEMIHCQIRYFIEIFTLQFARRHPETFFDTFVQEIPRRDLSLQMISSLMIISGNLIVGRYQHDFFLKMNGENDSGIDLNVILASVIPWLSSTQGFSRAIAQLLTHKLIPLVVDISNPTFDTKSNDWYIRSVYRFLEENPEMKRLRKKQTTFFEQYEVDTICTPEGVLSIPVDEGNESNPIHLIDLIKECLQNVYDEGNVDNAPTWRQMEYFAEAATNNEVHNHTNENIDGVNFQRKIIPVDALNLALDDIRKKKEENMVGRKKQNLIVCASLIDKIPNLGGLTRTAEIFAADRLVIPDIRITKMDNFKGLTVGAHDWIDIEECKEENLLQWLRQKKTEGFMIIGVEQTSSSQSLLDYQFPEQPIVLLLGKEKEGIPVQLLQVVDQCIEIPQLGIIRSLNVHVSGAICIWEHRKQQMKGKKM